MARTNKTKTPKDRGAEQAHLEQRLTELQAQLAQQSDLLNLVDDTLCVIVMDLNHAITFWNRSAERLYGWNESETRGQVMPTLLQTEFPQPIEEIQAELLRAGYWQGVLSHVTRAGKRIAVESRWALERDATGAPVAIVDLPNDTTERHSGLLAHSEADEQARHPASFPELNPNPVLQVDLSGNITFANPATHRILQQLGFDPANVKAFLPTDIDGIFRDWDKKNALSLDREIIIQVRVFGETVTLVPQLGVARLYAYDITERKLGEKRILDLNQELAQRARDLKNANEELEVTNEELRVTNEDLTKQVVERQQAEEALRVSEERFRFVLANSPVTVANIDRQLRYTWVYNPVASFKPDDILGKTPGLATDPETKEHILKLLQDVVTQGTSAQWETASRTVDGEKFFETYAEPLRDAKGEFTGAAMVSMDITARRRAESALRESEERFRTMADGSPEILWVTNAEGGLQFVNRRYREFFGVSFEEVEGGKWQPLVHPDDAAEYIASFRRSIKGHAPFTAETRVRRADGEWRWIASHAEPRFSPEGEFLGHVGLSPDITERKRVEEALRRRTEELQAIMEAVPTAVFITRDPDARTVTGNRAARTMVEPPPSANLSKSAPEQDRPTGWREMLDGLPIAPEDLPLQQAVRGKEVRDYEMDLVFRDGTAKSVLGNATPLRDESGNPQGGIAVLIDVTQRKRAEESLREALHRIQTLNQDLEERAGELEVANEELERLATSLALDLRAPLVSLHGIARVIAQDYTAQLPRQAQELFQLIDANAEEMEELTQGLLKLMRVTRQTLRKQELNPEEIVRAAWTELEPERGGRQVEIAIGHLPTCRADPLLLKQVWVNLLSNALKFTRPRDHARIVIGARPEENRTVYFVKDNGVGFDMSYAGTIFRAFQRYHHAEEWGGSGVGLAIVESIVRRHGGRVWAEGVVDEGATFYFTLE